MTLQLVPQFPAVVHTHTKINPGVVLLVAIWGVAFFGSAALNSVMRSDNPVVIRRGRIAFALLLALELLGVADAFNGRSHHTSHALWWGIALGGGIPIAIVLGFTIRRAYIGHRVALISAVLAAAALFLAMPLGFVPPHETLTGLGRFEHAHHALDIVALLIPTLILLASEVRRGHIEGPAQEFTIRQRLRLAARYIGVGGALALAFLVWLAGWADGTEVTIGVFVVAIGIYVAAEVQTHVAARRMRRNLER